MWAFPKNKTKQNKTSKNESHRLWVKWARLWGDNEKKWGGTTKPVAFNLTSFSSWKIKNCAMPCAYQTSDSPPDASPLWTRLCGRASSAWGSTWASYRRWWCCAWRGGPLAAAGISPESRAPHDSEVPAAPDLHAGPPGADARLPAGWGMKWIHIKSIKVFL